MRSIISAILALILLGGCTLPTFYERFYNFNKTVSDGNLQAAEKMLDENADKLEKGRLKFLYYVNAGLVRSMEGKFHESNEFFEKADLFVEDFKKKAGEQVSALLLNPNLTTYPGEDHEILMINYYKAVNYLQMGNYEEALVEARRMDLRLQELSDKYTSERRYQKDAFVNLLMGIIYDASGEYNNAFIAYRNAYEIYDKEYRTMFGFKIPDQLKHDLVRTADLSGIYDERDRFKTMFAIDYQRPAKELAELVILWNNGLGPIKDEWGINFAIIYGSNGWVTFVNEDYGMSFPFYLGDTNLSGLTWIKVVFPKYVERPLMFRSASIEYGGVVHNFDRAQDLNAISFKVLEERMLAEFTKSLLRVAIKQAAAAGVRKDNEGLGTALSILGNISESADTRNWQTLPHSIYYTRIPGAAGDHNYRMLLEDIQGTQYEHMIDVHLRAGETMVFPINTMATTFNPNRVRY
jgi:hypothetical protein